MNKIMKIFIICAVFALINSCKYYSTNKDSKDLKSAKQGLKNRVKGALDILNIKDEIASSGSKVYELAKEEQKKEKTIVGEIARKLQEEDEAAKDKEDNKQDVDLEEKEEPKNLLKNDNGLKPESIASENTEAKLETEKILKPEISERPKFSVAVKPEVKEKIEEEKAKEKEAEELRRRRIEQYKKEEKARLERKKEREIKKKLRELESSENFLEGITRSKISTVIKNVDKIISDIDSINLGSFEEKSEVSGKDVEDKVTGAIYDHITNGSSSENSIYSEWGDYLEEESGLRSLIEELEETRGKLRSKIKESDNKTNKNTVKMGDIKEDLEKLRFSLNKLQEYLQSASNKEEIQKVVKCLIDPDSDGCK